MKPEFHPAAAEELSAAVQNYEAISVGLGLDLYTEVRRVTELLCAMPKIGERLDSMHRRFPLQRFPFGLIFRLNGDVLQVIAFAHRRRRPGYWRNRK
jgi:hypothetical protein